MRYTVIVIDRSRFEQRSAWIRSCVSGESINLIQDYLARCFDVSNRRAPLLQLQLAIDLSARKKTVKAR